MPFTELPSLYWDENEQGASKQKQEPINKTTINTVIEPLFKYFFECFVTPEFSFCSGLHLHTDMTDLSNSASQDKTKVQRCILGHNIQKQYSKKKGFLM